MPGQLGGGLTLTPQKLQQLALGFDPFPALEAIDRLSVASATPPVPGLGGAPGSGITPPQGFDSIINGAPAQQPGLTPLTPDAIRQLSALAPPQPRQQPAAVIPQQPPIQVQPINIPGQQRPRPPTLAALLAGR